jgi:Ca2+-binding RTX toxin-like protein
MSRRTFTRITIGVATLGVATAVTASSAQATTTVWVDPGYIPSLVSPGLHIEGSKSADEVALGFDATTNEFVISDPAGVIVLGSQPTCTSESTTAARCPHIAPYVTSSLSGGDDRFTADATLPSSQISVQGEAGDDSIRLSNLGGSLSGGSGNDTLVGGPGGDRVKGGHGNDRLTGRGGDDYVIGGIGTDRLSGGGGEDHLLAQDDHRDKAIVCGPGTDRVIFDPIDPEPSNCERFGPQPQ